jgi:hypothetical protein
MEGLLKKLRENKVAAALGLALIVIAVVMLTKPQPSDSPAASPTAPTTTPEAAAPTEEQVAPAPTGGKATTGGSPSGYGETLTEYTGNFRFQFTNCTASPGTMAIKKGETVMLDNRDANPHTIKVGTRSFKLGPYGYAVMTTSQLGVLQITCDGGGAATINVQP